MKWYTTGKYINKIYLDCNTRPFRSRSLSLVVSDKQFAINQHFSWKRKEKTRRTRLPTPPAPRQDLTSLPRILRAEIWRSLWMADCVEKAPGNDVTSIGIANLRALVADTRPHNNINYELSKKINFAILSRFIPVFVSRYLYISPRSQRHLDNWDRKCLAFLQYFIVMKLIKFPWASPFVSWRAHLGLHSF